ncbi:glycosyltransferase family 2 protein [Hirschia litorea]|uniref:Glycosyltransferase family 2 protein n=1 Tax=Hirschia litorea TaxID=1199156 RepID=A0ABW2IPP1_9PROT
MAESIRDASVTVVIPTFNRSALLRECLDAVFTQSVLPQEVIVMDDGSRDDTQQIVQTYTQDIQLIHHENKGKAASLNVAIQAATHPWVWIVDDDDLVVSTALERLKNTLADNGDIDFVYSQHDRFRTLDNGGIEYFDTGYWVECEDVDFHLATMEDFFAHQPGMLVSRDAYIKLGLFDEGLKRSQDYDMLVRLACGFKGALCKGISFHQRLHDGDRGADSDRFEVAQREARWIEADKEIFRRLRHQLPVSDYLPRNISRYTWNMARQALLQRACIMGRKKLWNEAFLDITRVSQMTQLGQLTATEKAILKRLTGSKYGCEDILRSSDVISGFTEIGEASPLGSSIIYNIANGMKWRIKQAGLKFDLALAIRLMRIYLRLIWAAFRGAMQSPHLQPSRPNMVFVKPSDK